MHDGAAGAHDRAGNADSAVADPEVVGREGEIQTAASRVRLLVIPTDEEGVIAADTYELVR